MPMPVPASYNDITEDYYLREHVGTVWYDRRFYVPSAWENDRRIWIRFGSVHYEAFVVSYIKLYEFSIPQISFRRYLFITGILFNI